VRTRRAGRKFFSPNGFWRNGIARRDTQCVDAKHHIVLRILPCELTGPYADVVFRFPNSTPEFSRRVNHHRTEREYYFFFAKLFNGFNIVSVTNERDIFDSDGPSGGCFE
jgi:hypothetical protein